MMIEPTDEKYMNRCLDLAGIGMGNTSPNPMVGCVIVCDGKIIGEGYHRQVGGPHAEINAIAAVHDKQLLKNANLYVNLEPCSHYGRTPPCVDAIIAHGIPRVVVGAVDPHPSVSGRGISILEEAGVNITAGIMEDACRELNKRFYTFYEKKRPYIMFKWAQTADGFIAPEEDEQECGRPFWITNETDRLLVHKWRTEEMAIMVGTNTACKDNPCLNCRNWTGKSPLRVVLDKNLRMKETLNLFDQKTPTLIFNEKKNAEKNNLGYIKVKFDKNLLNSVLNVLFEKQIISVMIEGGAYLINSFLEADLWDEARVFINNKEMFNGCKAPVIRNQPIITERLDASVLEIYRNKVYFVSSPKRRD
jgi:diaminohydroxyphosphoribosylaminopyrimidine deaminase / 5-amino-6-(5-phosphoribosylamino)uracil reductase